MKANEVKDMDKYEIALKQARNYYPDNLFLDTIFPELRESEDEKNWKAVLEYVKDDSLRVWLEKQKEQKPAEWSEDDEHRRKDAIYFLKTARANYALTSAIDEAIDWIESRGPQPQWKPSEAQLDALWAALGVTDYVAGAWIENGGERSLGMSKDELHERLISLYKDLKDL